MREGYDYDRDDPTFIDDLRNSKQSVEIAAQWLSSMGYPVIVRPTFERPKVAQINEYSDNGDLEIIQRVEVKQRPNLTFTGKADFPYPSVIVDTCRAFDKAHPKPYAYLILNKTMTQAFVIDVKRTFPTWQRVEKDNRKTKRTTAYYECPLTQVACVSISPEGGKA